MYRPLAISVGPLIKRFFSTLTLEHTHTYIYIYIWIIYLYIFEFYLYNICPMP